MPAKGRRQGPRRSNPWIEYMRSTCSSGYRAEKARRQAASAAAAGGAGVASRKRRGDDDAAAARKRQRLLRRMVEVPRKRKRAMEQEPSLADRPRRVVKRPARFRD